MTLHPSPMRLAVMTRTISSSGTRRLPMRAQRVEQKRSLSPARRHGCRAIGAPQTWHVFSLHGCACWRPARGMPEWRPVGEKAIRAECPNTFFLKGAVVIRTGPLYEWRTNSGDPIRTAHDGLRAWFTCNPGMHSRRTGSSYFSLKRTFDFIQRLITSRHSFSVF